VVGWLFVSCDGCARLICGGCVGLGGVGIFIVCYLVGRLGGWVVAWLIGCLWGGCLWGGGW